jgi:outer membrane protein assembly factor BamE
MNMILRTTLIWLISRFFSQRATLRTLISAVSCTLLLTACSDWLPTAHRLDLEQGNNIRLEQLEKVKTGMSKNEVRQIMGLPMISDPFHNQRWDYIYRYLPKSGFERKSLLTLEFENNVLIKIDDSEFIEP